MRRGRVAHATAGKSPALRYEYSSFFYRVAFVDPIGAEVLGEVNDLHVLESERSEFIEGWGDVGAAIPGAASAVEDDLPGLRDFLDVIAKGSDSGRFVGHSDVFGPGDVGLSVKDAWAHVEDQRFLRKELNGVDWFDSVTGIDGARGLGERADAGKGE